MVVGVDVGMKRIDDIIIINNIGPQIINICML